MLLFLREFDMQTNMQRSSAFRKKAIFYDDYREFLRS